MFSVASVRWDEDDEAFMVPFPAWFFSLIWNSRLTRVYGREPCSRSFAFFWRQLLCHARLLCSSWWLCHHEVRGLSLFSKIQCSALPNTSLWAGCALLFGRVRHWNSHLSSLTLIPILSFHFWGCILGISPVYNPFCSLTLRKVSSVPSEFFFKISSKTEV